MKKILLILISIVALASCSKNEQWSLEDDIKDFFESHPYGVEFKNETKGTLYIECESCDHMIIVDEGSTSDVHYSEKPNIRISYSGEGTYWTKKYKFIGLEKNKVITVSITYP